MFILNTPTPPTTINKIDASIARFSQLMFTRLIPWVLYWT